MNARVHPSARASTPSLRSAWKRSFLALALLLAGCGQEADPASTPPTGSATHGATTRDGSRDTSGERDAAPSAPAAAEDLVRWSGRVVDAQGRPIGGAEVVLAEELRPWPHQDTRALGQALSGADGDFLFAVREARDLVFEVRAPGFAPSRLSADPALHTHIVRLDPGFRVHGIVTLNYAPTPLAGARVSLEPGRSSAEPALLTTTDDEGRFEFVDVGASISGTARITVRHAPFRPAMLPGVPIGSPEPVRITVDPQPWAPLVGQVVRAGSGQPIVGATVRVHPGLGWNNRLSAPSEAMTDEQGRFRLQDPPLGPSLLVVEHPEMSAVARSITVGASADAQWIEMVRRSSVLVRAGGEAVEGTELVLISAGGERGRARVGADRVARFEGRFSAGPATLEVEGGVRIFQASSGRVITAVVEDGDATEIDVVLAAPSVLEGKQSGYFDLTAGSPYMLLVAPVKSDKRRNLSPDEERLDGIAKLKAVRSELPAVTHVDCSARVQTVSEHRSPRFHAILSAFEKRTGCPVLINTSFNIRGEPIVNSPSDAYRCFMFTDMDVLVVEDCLMHKKSQSRMTGAEEYRQGFRLD